MGNCMVSQRRGEALATYADPLDKNTLGWKTSALSLAMILDHQKPSEDDATYPLSPFTDISESPRNSSSSEFSFSSPNAVHHHQFEMDLSPLKQTATKALQHRLENARTAKDATMREKNKDSRQTQGHRRSKTNKNNTPTAVWNYYYQDDDDNDDDETPSSFNNDDFETSLSDAIIWADTECSSAVHALAMASTTKRLYLAMGTDTGIIQIQELLDENDSKAHTTSNHDDDIFKLDDVLSEGRLGRPYYFFTGAGKIRSLDFSPDGAYLAVGADDGSCRVLQNQHLCVLLQRVDRVYAVQFSPDNKYLAVGGFDGTVAIVTRRAWTESSTDVLVEIQRDGLVLSLDWSPDSRYLAVGGSDKCCAIVDTTEWKLCHEIRRPGAVHCVKWCGNLLAVGSINVAIFDRACSFGFKRELENPGTSRTRSTSTYTVNSLCWSPNGTYLVVCGSNRTCTMLETKTWTLVHERRGTSVAWGQQIIEDGSPLRYLAISGGNNANNVSILKAGLELNASGSSVCDDFSSTSSWMSASRSEWTLKERAFRDMDVVEDEPSTSAIEDNKSVTAIAFSSGSKLHPSMYLAYGLTDGYVIVRSTIQYSIVAELRFSKPMQTLTFSKGSRFMALGSEDGRVIVVATGNSWEIVAKQDFSAPVMTLGYSKLNERVAVGLKDGIVALLNPTQKYAVEGEIDGHSSAVSSLDWTSKLMAVGRLDGSVAIYESLQVYSNFCFPAKDLQHSATVCSVSFGANGRFLAVAGVDGVITIYSAKGDWVRCHQLKISVGLTDMSWSSTSRYLALVGEDGIFRMIDTAFWAEVDDVQSFAPTRRTNDCSQAPALAFSQDGEVVAYTSNNNGVRVIDTKTWKILHRSDLLT